MDNVVTVGDERWQAWVAANGWDPCLCCDLQGYHQFGSDQLQCAECDGFGFIIPGIPKGVWHSGNKED